MAATSAGRWRLTAFLALSLPALYVVFRIQPVPFESTDVVFRPPPPISSQVFGRELDASSLAQGEASTVTGAGGKFEPLPCDYETTAKAATTRVSARLVCSGALRGLVRVRMTAGTPVESVNWANGACLEDAVKRQYSNNDLRIPRVLHYVYIGSGDISQVWLVGAISAARFYQPCLLLFHGDLPRGPRWDLLLALVPDVIHVARPVPTTIFGRKLQVVQHQSDVIRIEALIRYGGLYLDSDHWLLRPVASLRAHPAVVGESRPKEAITNSILMAEPNSTFMQKWYDTYHTFDDAQWAEHSCRVPYRLAAKEPDIVHVVRGRDVFPINRDIKGWYKDTTRSDVYEFKAVHLYARHVDQKHFSGRPQDRDTRLGRLMRYILHGATDKCFRKT